jgi:hypothetical protein
MNQRKSFKKGTLLPERIDELNNTEGWEWEQSRTFQENNSDWSEQFVILGRAPSRTSKNAAEKRAGIWQMTQRGLFKKGTLPKERINELNKTAGWEWEQSRTFQESKSDWSEQFVILGRTPSQHSKNAAEKRAGIWQTNQRALFKKGTLLPERIDELNNTEGWEWEQGGVRTFQESNSDWSEQFVNLGRAPSSSSKNADEKRAGKWQTKQRALFKKGTLLPERIDELNNTEGWEWEEQGIRTFQESNSDWSEQFVNLGRAPSRTSKNAGEKRAGIWQTKQRGLFKKGTLLPERIDELNNTEGWEWEQGGVRTFQESNSDWSEQFVKLGRTPSQYSKNAAEKRAGQWQTTQRQLFKKGTLLPERIDELNNTEGWEWGQGVVRTFQESNSDWIEQFVILGRAPSRYSKNAGEKRAGIWQTTQRGLFKKGTLLPERIDELNKTAGWEWGRGR